MSYKDKGVLFIGAFAGSREKEIRRFAETYNITYPVGQEKGIGKALGVSVIPTTVFINKDGMIVKRHVNTIDYEELTSGIEAIME